MPDVERGYLGHEDDGYLDTEYLASGEYEDVFGMQANMQTRGSKICGMQAQQVINATKKAGMQAQMIVNDSNAYGMQALMILGKKFGMQARMVIYNATQLRLMWEFPSRGTAVLLGLNWTASSQFTGDYSPNNLNTDVVEQVYRSGAGTDAFVQLDSDTGVPQGVSIDTIAILNHNLTKSAQVQVQGSLDNFATPAQIVYNIPVEQINMYYISPTFPPSTGQNRYWRFIIQDPDNPDGYIQIGTILYGTSRIFSKKEFPIQPIVNGKRHFKDASPSEGFTTVSNDRALKKFLRLSFEKLHIPLGNFAILEEMEDFARTSLKVLVIPMPRFASRFAVFGKLTLIPDKSHIDNSGTIAAPEDDARYVDVDYEWDESQ